MFKLYIVHITLYSILLSAYPYIKVMNSFGEFNTFSAPNITKLHWKRYSYSSLIFLHNIAVVVATSAAKLTKKTPLLAHISFSPTTNRCCAQSILGSQIKQYLKNVWRSCLQFEWPRPCYTQRRFLQENESVRSANKATRKVEHRRCCIFLGLCHVWILFALSGE